MQEPGPFETVDPQNVEFKPSKRSKRKQNSKKIPKSHRPRYIRFVIHLNRFLALCLIVGGIIEILLFQDKLIEYMIPTFIS